jgi:predicted GIY-YIG superfamily endonuclease
MAYVYWLFDETCSTVNCSGYVGVTATLKNRFKSHKKRFGDHISIAPLFEGTREECFFIERGLRPSPGMGWNRAVGGSQGWSHGFSHSKKTKDKLKKAWTEERKLEASRRRKELNKSLRGQKRSLQSKKMQGSNNPMYGTKRPQYVIDAMAEGRRRNPPVQEIYCVGCHERAPWSILKKYHNKCFKSR